MAPGSFGVGSGKGSSAGLDAGNRKAPFAHIDDLTSVTVDIDPHTPMKKVLDMGEACMRQAVTYKDFGRPDMALKEYIKAFTIAVDKIPKHKDYPSLKTDRSDLGRLYNDLNSKITTNGNTFGKIKENIKADNQRSGVQPRKAATLSATEHVLMNLPSAPSTLPSQYQPNGLVGTIDKPPNEGRPDDAPAERPRGSVDGARRVKPVVHPKPQALHGNAISSGPKASSQDLTARFAKLRGSQEVAPLSTPQAPAGPRAMPPPSRPRPIINSAVPAMPKMPDAVYSPARGTVTSEVAELPSSTTRGMFSRTNSIVSISSTSARNSMDLAMRPALSELAGVPTTNSDMAPSITSPRIAIPAGDTISPELLHDYMQKSSTLVRLLLIDVRSREEFDDGHILAQSTICVEPAFLNRGDVSAADVEESMGIAPDEEMQAFEQRGKFDLVVLYDQETTEMPKQPSRDPQKMVLYILLQALVHYNYGGELRNAPKLLAGGVDAWIDVFGQRSLKESQTSAAIREGHARKSRTNGIHRSGFTNRRRRTQTKTLQPEELRRFEEVIKHDTAAVKSPMEFVRSTEEFFRRYPSAADIQESMTSPETFGSTAFSGGHEPEVLYRPELPPAPPTRPAPSVPRTSYSGLSSRDASGDVVYAKAGNVVGIASLSSAVPSGLINKSNRCYANSLIQSMLASPGFAAEMTSEEWPWSRLPPGISRGDKKHPQLMAQILGNLFQWLSKRQMKALEPATLLRYSNSIHTPFTEGGVTYVFGDSHQHDPAEYFDFLLDQLERETNRIQVKTDSSYLKPRDHLRNDPRLPKMSMFDLTLESWQIYVSQYQSITQDYWMLTTPISWTCRICGQRGDTSESVEVLSSLTVHRPARLQDLGRWLESTYLQGEEVENTCTVCNKTTTKIQSTRLGRLPPLLRIQVNWYGMGTTKSTGQFYYPVDDLDLTKYAIDNGRQPTSKVPASYQRGQLVYDLYAVISHAGPTKNSGHYIADVRDGPGTKWWHCNDSAVTELDIVSSGLPNKWYRCADSFTPYLLFYKRKDVKWKYPSRV